MAANNNNDDLTKIEKLNGSNYKSWKYNIKLVLMGRGLWSIAFGSEKAPVIAEADKAKAESLKLINDWNLRSDKAYSLIALSISKSLQVHISATTDAHEAWKILQKHFEVVSVSQIVRLNRRFFAAQMKEGDDLQAFITEMMTVAQELRELNEEISMKKFATVILGSLPPSYDNFVTSFNTQSVDDLNWDNVRGLLNEEYLKRKDNSDRNSSSNNNEYQQVPLLSSEQALFTTSGGGRGRGNFRGGSNHRGGVGTSYRGGGRGGSRGRGGSSYNVGGNARVHPYNNRVFQGSCYNCGAHGHKANNCSQNSDQDQGLFVGDAGNHGRDGDPFHENDIALITEFIAESHDVRANMALSTELNDINNTDYNQRTNSKKQEWYIDSAATRHMTYDKSILIDFRWFSEEEKLMSKVKLGNDYIIPAVGEGKVRLATSSDENGQFLALQKVAYVPRLTKNLLSVSMMTDNGAEVRFDKEKCV